jgi:hypothetical protein
MKEKYLNKEFQSNNSGKYTVIEYFDNLNTTIQFEDGTILKNITTNRIRTGVIKNYNYPSFCSKGRIGYGKYSPNEDKKALSSWKNMLVRCYNEKQLDKNLSYNNAIICEEWHNFQNYAEWFYENYDESNMRGWVLSKGILAKNNKTYSPETCCFAPQELNKIIREEKVDRKEYPIGVYKRGTYISCFNNKQIAGYETAEKAFENYKERKESYIKVLAEEWKPKIQDNLYQALLNYRVEITD